MVRTNPRRTATLRLLLTGAALATAMSGSVGRAEVPGSVTDFEPGPPLAVRIEVGDRRQLEQLTRLVDIDGVSGNEVRAAATAEQLERLREAGFKWRRAVAEPEAVGIEMCPDGWVGDDDRAWTCYPSYGQYVALVQRFASTRPDICRLVDLGPGTNVETPHRLWALVISDNPELDEDEPEVLLTSTMHGDETAGYVLLLRLAGHLLAAFDGDSEIAQLVKATEIWINPLANPDGTYFAGDHTVAGAIRNYTGSDGSDSGVNANRNFPNPDSGPHPDGHPWWPETEAMMALAESKTFVLSANLHGGAEVVNYPWDTWQRRHPDDAWFAALSRDYADLAQADSPGGYLTDLDNGITNGWDWYQVFGSRQDWITFYHGGREVTIELSAAKLVPSDRLDDLWQWNRRALVDFIAHAHAGIRGVVTDQEGRPLAARVEVLNLDRAGDGSVVRTDPEVGDFHRLLLPGLYDLEITAAGCRALTIFGVAVGDGDTTRVDARLWCPRLLRPSRRLAP